MPSNPAFLAGARARLLDGAGPPGQRERSKAPEARVIPHAANALRTERIGKRMTPPGPNRAFESLYVGDPAPWFRQGCIGQSGDFSFDMIAGRFVALCFYGSADDVCTREALDLVEAHRAMFDNVNIAFFGVSNDPRDESDPRLSPTPGVRHFADADCSVARAYGVAPRSDAGPAATLRRYWYILDPRLRIIAIFPVDAAGNAAAAKAIKPYGAN